MSGGMPYHVEKGPLQRLLETYLNGDRATITARRDKLARSVGSPSWLTQGIFKHLDKAPLARANQTKDDLYRHLMQHWFGFVEHPAGAAAPANWYRQDVQRPGYVAPTTGFWIAYSGNVAEIMRQGFQWAMDVALALPPTKRHKPPPPPLRIEILWNCPSPWFELWVMRRPFDLATADEAIVTVLMTTPPQEGASVATSPVAIGPSTRGFAYPVPSWEEDYESLTEPWPPGAAAHRPRPAAAVRPHAMWVVTHRHHQPVGAGITGMPMWAITLPLGAVYQGLGDVVVVAPSSAAGGVKFDGSVI